MTNINRINEANELLNKVGNWKKENDPNDLLSLMDAVIEFADFNNDDIDEYIDILSDNESFKALIKQDLIQRGMIYLDGERPERSVTEEW